jgi:hypothetical protein
VGSSLEEDVDGDEVIADVSVAVFGVLDGGDVVDEASFI